ASALIEACNARLGCEHPALILTCSERSKTQATVTAIYDAALEAELDREGALVCVGGGVCLDLATMAASTIRRGIGLVRVPTTLIGQVDAAIGVKGSLNYGNHKSYLGCFYPPELVVVDPACLAGLAERHVRAGLAEIVKMAVIAEPELF